MRSRIIRIGNSRGVRLPKVMIEQAHLGDEVEIEAEPNQVIIRSAYVPRRGWDDAFQRMAATGEDSDLFEEARSLSSFDETDWKW